LTINAECDVKFKNSFKLFLEEAYRFVQAVFVYLSVG